MSHSLAKCLCSLRLERREIKGRQSLYRPLTNRPDELFSKSRKVCKEGYLRLGWSRLYGKLVRRWEGLCQKPKEVIGVNKRLISRHAISVVKRAQGCLASPSQRIFECAIMANDTN